MRLSRLSDRQLRRLVRNAEVRFGEETVGNIFKQMAILTIEFEKKLNSAKFAVDKIWREENKLPKEYRKQAEDLQKVWSSFMRLINDVYYLKKDFARFSEMYKDNPIK